MNEYNPSSKLVYEASHSLADEVIVGAAVVLGLAALTLTYLGTAAAATSPSTQKPGEGIDTSFE